jgi:hypothetical protein
MSALIRIVVATAAAAAALLAPAAGESSPTTPLSWSPTTSSGTFDFGAVSTGRTASQTFTLSSSKGKLSGLAIGLTGSAAFTKTADNCTGASVDPNHSCSVTVRYAPTTAGQSDSATLTASGKQPKASAVLNLRGSGAATTRHIYWANYNTSTVGRADPDGSNPNQSFITGGSCTIDVTVDSGHVYWANYCAGTIGRANLDGSSPNQSFIDLTGFGANPGGLTVDSGHVYWSDIINNNNTIGRADLDGSNVNPSFITVGITGGQVGVAVDSGHVYWTTYARNTIGRADLDGTNVNQEFITGGASWVDGVAVDSGHVYWANSDGTIGRANLDGTNVNQSLIVTGASGNLSGVAVDPGHVYWADYGPSGNIGRADLDGSNPNPGFIPGVGGPEGVAVDAG